MTVCRLSRGGATRVREAHARRLLAVTSAAVARASVRRDAVGTRRRLRALAAVGHPAVSLARHLDVPPSAVRAVIGGKANTVTATLHAGVCELYEQMWDQRPCERTPAERRAAAAARSRAARHGWPTPMGLDDDRIDDPGYQPRTGWHPSSGTGVASGNPLSTDPGRGVAAEVDRYESGSANR